MRKQPELTPKPVKWSRYDLDRLREYWPARKEDHTYLFTTKQIGERLDRSKNSIVGKAHRLLLEERPSPIKRGVIPKDRSISRRAPKTTLPSMRGLPHVIMPPPRPVIIKRPVMKAPPPRPPPERPYGRIVNCCWPIGNARPQQFCGDTSEPGKPYCAEHAKLAYVRVRDPRERVLEETGD